MKVLIQISGEAIFHARDFELIVVREKEWKEIKIQISIHDFDGLRKGRDG